MTDGIGILVTGGNGLLGTTLKTFIPKADFVDIGDFDITDFDAVDRWLGKRHYTSILHCAAFTSPPKVDADPTAALEVNIAGTVNMVKAAIKHKLKLVYICTDYVFRGDKGNYSEDDPVFPVNKYAWSKLGGECAVRMYDNSLIIRTTFGPKPFPYPKAFVDQWTSRESVDVIAKMIAELLDKNITGTVHVGGKRKTVFDYAAQLDPSRHIEELKTAEVSFSVPRDTSLNVSLYHLIMEDKD
ncbi:MAG: sugar nucleotide-binding protein [Spirochaetales bacterium]|nr:sugar nucleotide-binding protein [Spirochaetales bacterium]